MLRKLKSVLSNRFLYKFGSVFACEATAYAVLSSAQCIALTVLQNRSNCVIRVESQIIEKCNHLERIGFYILNQSPLLKG
jgi:L-lysine 2,3-aminomutase